MAGSLPSSSSNFHLNWAVGAWHGCGGRRCLGRDPHNAVYRSHRRCWSGCWKMKCKRTSRQLPRIELWGGGGGGSGRREAGGGKASDNQAVKCASIYVAAVSPRLGWWAAAPAVSRTSCSRFLLFLISFLPVFFRLNKQLRAASRPPSSLLLPHIRYRDPFLYCFRRGSTIIKLLRALLAAAAAGRSCWFTLSSLIITAGELPVLLSSTTSVHCVGAFHWHFSQCKKLFFSVVDRKLLFQLILRREERQ